MNVHMNPEYWLNIAETLGSASTCRAEVGCVLTQHNTIVGHGYVGSVHGDYHCDKEEYKIVNNEKIVTRPDYHMLVPAPYRGINSTTCIRTIHAEMNAILKCTVRGSEGHWIHCYCTHQPCLECLKCLLQIGVRRIYYGLPYEDKRRETFIEGFLLPFVTRMRHDERDVTVLMTQVEP